MNGLPVSSLWVRLSRASPSCPCWSRVTRVLKIVTIQKWNDFIKTNSLSCLLLSALIQFDAGQASLMFAKVTYFLNDEVSAKQPDQPFTVEVPLFFFSGRHGYFQDDFRGEAISVALHESIFAITFRNRFEKACHLLNRCCARCFNLRIVGC